ncbi:MAG: hypothetical protein KME64_23925 [Scytonematopsis contorta HA4267-MV1]|jgi:hypothetical protein|nr:hypothetical protein [Scytonematopsis contorta HA4267-MV1]
MTLEQIEAAILKLSPDDYQKLLEWFSELGIYKKIGIFFTWKSLTPPCFDNREVCVSFDMVTAKSRQ